MVLASLLGALFLTSVADAAARYPLLQSIRPKISVAESVIISSAGPVVPRNATMQYFDQLIDHDNPGLGTFRQRYLLGLDHYESGGPVTLLTPGNNNIEYFDFFLTNITLSGMIAQQQKGMVIALENRFFGDSNPYDNLTSQSLELLTIQQSVEDIAYFAQNVDLPVQGGDNMKPDTTPWILTGGGFSGAMTSWAMVNKPDIFRAGYATSASVQAMTDFDDFFTPIREYMPQNCSADVQVVIGYLDQMYAENNTVALQNLQQTFGLGNLSHVEDFAAALQYIFFDWQSDSGPDALFFEFCDALEVKDGVSASLSGWGLQNTINSWGRFWNDTYYNDVCGKTDAETCLGTYNPSSPIFTNVTVNNSYRSWTWIICNQVGWYQVGPPEGQPTIVSRIVDVSYFTRQCVNMFPDKFSSPPLPSVDAVNSMYEGWNVHVDRLFFANGRRDPWRGTTVSADGLNVANTSTQPVYESNGFYCSDFYAADAAADPTVLAVQEAGLGYIKTWLQ